MNMKMILGVLLVTVFGGGLGVSAAAELRRDAWMTAELCRAAGRMQTLVCRHRMTLPAAVERLREEFPALLAPGLWDAERLSEQPFSSVWGDLLTSLHLPGRCEEHLRRLGTALSGGDEPEPAFAACMEELDAEKTAAEKKAAERVKLYIPLGFSLGAMAAVLLA